VIIEGGTGGKKEVGATKMRELYTSKRSKKNTPPTPTQNQKTHNQNQKAQKQKTQQEGKRSRVKNH